MKGTATHFEPSIVKLFEPDQTPALGVKVEKRGKEKRKLPAGGQNDCDRTKSPVLMKGFPNFQPGPSSKYLLLSPNQGLHQKNPPSLLLK
jgi:hypothetical protein